jgi:hypothetical protein
MMKIIHVSILATGIEELNCFNWNECSLSEIKDDLLSLKAKP